MGLKQPQIRVGVGRYAPRRAGVPRPDLRRRNPAGGWTIPGWPFPEEPPTWIASVIKDGVSPMPRFDVRSLSGDDDAKRVAIVEIEPVATPPCFSRGTVYERIPGQSIHVKDPLRLAELYQRGAAAHEGARVAAANAAKAMIVEQGYPDFDQEFARFVLAMNATGHPPDISSRLFSEAYEDSLTNSVRDRLAPVRGNLPPTIVHGFTQSARTADTTDVEYTHRRMWHVRVIWNGTVAIHHMTDLEYVSPQELAQGAIKDAWATAGELLTALGGYGPAYMELRVRGGEAMRVRRGAALDILTLRRGPTDATPDESLLSSVEREMRRAMGEVVYEPPPDDSVPPAEDAESS